MMVLKASHDALLQIYLKADVLLIDGIVVRKISELIYERSSEASRYRYGQMLEAFLEDLKNLKLISLSLLGKIRGKDRVTKHKGLLRKIENGKKNVCSALLR